MSHERSVLVEQWTSPKERGSSRGFFKPEKDCLVLQGAAWHWGGIEIAQCTNPHGGAFWTPVAPGPVPFFGF